MKTCFKCGELKPLDKFYKHKGMADGRLNKCKECQKAASLLRTRSEAGREYDRDRYYNDPDRRAYCHAKSEEHRIKNPLKTRARVAVGNAVRNGKLTRPDTCSECGMGGDGVIEAHHEDYTRPLDVEWLCSRCHGKRHRKKK